MLLLRPRVHVLVCTCSETLRPALRPELLCGCRPREPGASAQDRSARSARVFRAATERVHEFVCRDEHGAAERVALLEDRRASSRRS